LSKDATVRKALHEKPADDDEPVPAQAQAQAAVE
jgi:hypothetical protein